MCQIVQSRCPENDWAGLQLLAMDHHWNYAYMCPVADHLSTWSNNNSPCSIGSLLDDLCYLFISIPPLSPAPIRCPPCLSLPPPRHSLCPFPPSPDLSPSVSSARGPSCAVQVRSRGPSPPCRAPCPRHAPRTGNTNAMQTERRAGCSSRQCGPRRGGEWQPQPTSVRKA